MTHRRRRANNFIMKTISITLRDDGTVYRDHDDKHIATVTNGEIDWKHHTYKHKHSAEVESLVEDVDNPEEENTVITTTVDTGADGEPTTPPELFVNGEAGGEKAGWYGEENPPVVEWRRKNWGKAAFKAHYGHKTETLTEIYEQEGLTYNA